MSRLFFALDLNTADKSALAAFREQYLSVPFKPVDKNNYHITLCFLGAVTTDQQQTLIAQADKLTHQIFPIVSQQLQLNQIALFKKPKILYFSHSQIPNWLLTLASELSDCAKSLALFQEERPYLPHISIYRKAGFIPSNLPKIKINIIINSFSLYQSVSSTNGVKYQAIKTWRLT